MRISGWIAFAVVLAACGDDGGGTNKSPIKIGLSVSLSGSDAVFGQRALQTVQLAVQVVNGRGGIDGHPLELVYHDDATDETTAGMVVERLITEDQVVAVVGPFFSGAVDAGRVHAKDNMVPLISPSSTAPFLATADDGGFVFRNVPNDNFQSLAIAHYLRDVATPAISTIAIVAEDSDYGLGLAAALRSAFEGAGGTVDGDPITFPPNLDPMDAMHQAAIDNVSTELDARAPEMAVIIALANDGNLIVTDWSTSGLATGVQWFGTDGVRSGLFLQGLPGSFAGMLGTAPTYPTTGDAFQEFTDAFNDEYMEDVSEEAYVANTWDAVLLVAAALLVQARETPDGPFGGAALRDALTQVSGPPGQILHAGQFSDLRAAIARGDDVDYDGASGPCDFDQNGEALGPYEVWEIVDNGMGGLTFMQSLYIDPRDLN